MSIFPPSAQQGLPDFSTLLVSGQYHPSAPVHLALSLQQQKVVIIHPSRSDFQRELNRFDDAWLKSQSDHGSITKLTAKIETFYPPSPAHLCMLLSVLPAANSGNLENTGFIAKCGSPNVLILVEVSRLFFLGESENTSTISSYLNVVQRALAYVSFNHTTTMAPQKLVLFESRLQELKVPLTNQPSIFPESRQPREVQVLPIVEKYFGLIGILEDDPFLVPSSQSNEVPECRKQLRLYKSVNPSDSFIHCQWSEKTCSVEGISGTWFIWT